MTSERKTTLSIDMMSMLREFGLTSANLASFACSLKDPKEIKEAVALSEELKGLENEHGEDNIERNRYEPDPQQH